jgi:hypothetical protein
MIDYTDWERKEFSVTSLQLDPMNPRVSGLGISEMGQPSIIQRFIENYGVYELAKSIAENGYFPDEVIIVFRQDEKNRYVLEGNRRITALKLLLNPDIAPDEFGNKFRKLSEKVNKSFIEKVQTVVAPSRESATPIIIEKHTHTAVKPWSVLMKAAFVRNLIDQNKDMKPEQIGITREDFDRFSKMDKMYRLACSLDLPDDVTSTLRNKEKFQMTNVERLYNNPEIRKALGLSDNFENLEDRKTFQKLFASMIIDICRGDEDSRSLDSEDNRREYAKKLRARAPKISKKLPSSVSELLKQTIPKEKAIGLAKGPIKTRSTKKARGIIPSGFSYRLTEGASLRKLCDELKKLEIERFANTGVIAFRVFLEKSIKMFLKTNGINKIPVSPSRPRPAIMNVGDAQLGDLLEYIGKKDIPVISDNNVKTNVRRFKSDSTFPSLSALNNAIHSEENYFVGEQARNLWPSLERLFIIMLSQTDGGVGIGQLQESPEVSRGKKKSI